MKKYEIPAIYLGERLTLLGSVFHVFRDAKTNLYRFTGLKSIFFGETYLVSKDGSIKVRPDVSLKKLDLMENDFAEFEAHKILAKDARLNKRKAMELKKPHADIVKAIELLRPFIQSVPRYDQDRFLRYIHNEATKRKKRK